MTKQITPYINETRILVVEDEVLIAEYLKEVLAALFFSHIKLAHTREQALSEISLFKPDLILLDIRMEQELEGIDIAQEINEHYRIPFIFITAHSDKQIIEKALNTNPSGYITKPFKKIDVYAAINLALKKAKENEKRVLIFKDGYLTTKLPFDNILYVESEGNHIHIHATHKKYTLRRSLDWFIENTPANEFCKVHRSYVVNFKKADKTSAKSIFIHNKEIPVSRSFQVDLARLI